MNDKLFGLVLAGGQSQRMGKDKGLISWHGKEHRYYEADVLEKLCDDVYVSCRDDQKEEINNAGYKTIVDNFSEASGPYGAMVTALREHPDKAWLVIACDLPFFDEKSAKFLIKSRDLSAIATAYRNPVDGLPEPLAAIWEPRSLKRLIQLFEDGGITCPRKALIKSSTEVKLIDPRVRGEVMNVNTPEDLLKAEGLKP